MIKTNSRLRAVIFALIALSLMVLPFATSATSTGTSVTSTTAGSAAVASSGGSVGSLSTGSGLFDSSSIGSGTLFQAICEGVTVSDTEVTLGDSVTFTWNTSQYQSLTINGSSVSGGSHTMAINQLGDNIIQVVGFDTDNKPCAIQIIVVCVPPAIIVTCDEFRANPSTIERGSAAILSWNTTNATEVVIDNNIGSVSVDGSRTVSPDVTTTYTLTAKGPNNTSETCQTTVTVNQAPPAVPVCDSFTASPASITEGDSATLFWNTTNATQVSIDNNIGNVSADGSRSVSPTNTTTYTLTVAGVNNTSDTCQTTITVTDTPTPPTPPQCPLNPADYDTIINFSETRLRSDQSQGQAESRIFATNLTAGEYEVTLVSWDGYIGRENVTQPQEQWKLALSGAASSIETGVVSDVPDFVREAIVVEKVNSDLVLNQTITGVQAKHAFFPDTSSPNSVRPICAAFEKKVVEEPAPVCESFTASPASIKAGESTTLTWDTTNAARIAITGGFSNLPVDGTASVLPLVTTTYTLSVFDANNVVKDTCTATVTIVPEDPAPVCDFFRATPNTIVRGDSTTLEWGTTNATTVRLNGVDVAVDGSQSVSPTNTTTYNLTLIGAEDQTIDCSATVTVTEDPMPVCVAFTATPAALPVGGGNVTFIWDVENASTVNISPLIGSVAQIGTTTRNVTQSTTFTLTASDADGDTVSCIAPVAVADPVAFTCENNVSFSASDTSIRRGEDTALTWAVTGADSVSITDIGTVQNSGSDIVSPNSDRTYTLTATQGNNTIQCPLPINVSTGGGGGGGSASPRCDLDISDTRITRGESITLRWDTSRARELTIVDDRGRVIVTTEDRLSRDKDELFDGSIRLTPTRDTEYTLTVERGSRDRTCRVEVEVDGGQVLGQVRSQEPLIAGIALSQVPYTGFEAGPVLTLLFYVLILAWALYIAYFLVIRDNGHPDEPKMIKPVTVNAAPKGVTLGGIEKMKAAEEQHPDAFTNSTTDAPTSTVPDNLPTSEKPIGYESYFAGTTVNEVQADSVVTELENRAHAQHTLLSSDAVETFLRSTEGNVERNALLDKIIATAKSEFPLEDGWMVLNKTRMESLCAECLQSTPVVSAQIGESLPDGSGSLAEAIVTGNVVAAYEMIGNRPMFALANAAADLDSVVRHRKGDTSPISDLLLSETEKLSNEQLQTMITALTGAIDGTYTDEASAVKMAIMKAVKEVA